MTLDPIQFRAELYPAEKSGPAAAPHRARVDAPAKVSPAGMGEYPASGPAGPAPAAVVPWVDPAVAGCPDLGNPEEQMRTLLSLHDLFARRSDPIARNAAAVLLEEVRNRIVLNGQLNNLVE